VTVRVDPFRLHAGEYRAGRSPRVLTVPPARYLALAGRGEPGGPLFQEQAAAIVGVARSLRMAIRVERDKDFRIPPLEALRWDGESEAGPGGAGPSSWRLLLRMPSFVHGRDLVAAAARLEPVPHAAEVRLEELREGRCVQALHVGPCSSEEATLDRMRRAAVDQGLAFRGRHHEIYLSDARRVAPERLRTVLRRPVRAR
jgi:hypothetical protein